MTIKQIRAFLAVAHSLSFAVACERLHLSQSALSLTIKALEEGLGGRLFSRNTRNVALTPEGESLLPLARRLIADWDNAEDEMRQRFSLQRGRVTLAAMPSFAGNLLPPILKSFRARYPNVNVTVNDVINEQVLEMVRDRQVELGVAFAPMQSTSMTFTPLYVDRFVAVVPADSALAGRADIDWQTLLEQPFITLAAAINGAGDAGRAFAGARNEVAGGVREPSIGDGRANGCQRAWGQRGAGIVRGANA